MDVETILREEAEELTQTEATRKHNLEALRKLQKSASAISWQEALPLVASTPQERLYWASTIEKDSALGKSVRQIPLSSHFTTGVPEKKNPTVQLIRLLSVASQKAGVKLPKSVIVDLPKSGLPEKYADLLDEN